MGLICKRKTQGWPTQEEFSAAQTRIESQWFLDILDDFPLFSSLATLGSSGNVGVYVWIRYRSLVMEYGETCIPERMDDPILNPYSCRREALVRRKSQLPESQHLNFFFLQIFDQNFLKMDSRTLKNPNPLD